MKAARVILIAVWCLIPVLALVGLLLLTGCGTISDKHSDFPPYVPSWEGQ